MFKSPKISEFRDKIVLCKLVSNVDDELNRYYDIVPVREVWAVSNVKSANVVDTTAGFRSELQYEFIIRNQPVLFDCIKWNNKVLKLVKPYYNLNPKYIVLECVENRDFPAETN